MKKYENINPTEAEKMMYFNAGLYPVKRVKNQDTDFIKYGVTTIEDVNVYPSFITAYSYRSSITFDNKCQFIHFDNVIIQLQLMDILCQRCDELKWEFPHFNNELVMGVKLTEKETEREAMKNKCISLLIQPNTFIEGIDYIANHYEALVQDFFFETPNKKIGVSTLKAAISYSAENDIVLKDCNELLEMMNTEDFMNFVLNTEPLCMIKAPEGLKKHSVSQSIEILGYHLCNYFYKK